MLKSSPRSGPCFSWQATQCLFVKWLLLSLLLFSNSAYGAERTPEEFVRDFYLWYFEADKGDKLAEFNDDIYGFVAKETVDRIRRHESDGLYYFTKKGTQLPECVEVIVHESTSPNGEISIVPVSFHMEKSAHVVVIVEKDDGLFKISHVYDIYPHS